MLRIHFTNDDLGRTCVTAVPNYLWEAVNGVQLLQNREGSLIFDDWRRAVRTTARHTPLWDEIGIFAAVCPHAPYFPDFLTPAAPFLGLDDGIDLVLSTPRRRLHDELSRLAASRSLPGWAAALAVGDPITLRRIGTVIRHFHAGAIAPYLQCIHTALNAECASRAWIALRGGTEALLASFAPLMTWTPPVLEVRYPFPQTLHLRGRGLRLVPSFFCWRNPITLADPDLTPTLVYPIEHRPGWTRHDAHHTRSTLAALIGSTRARLLEAAAEGRTTTELARLANISAATATHHTTVLRDSNLIASRRKANTVIHTITPMGMRLLTTTAPTIRRPSQANWP